MPKAVPGITYTKDEKSPVIDSPTSPYIIPYYKDESFLNNYESYEKYVKAIERVVRTNDRYKKYISYLKKEVKLNRCQVLKNITDEDASIEMHHGPVFTLFDVCAIVLEYFLLKKWDISTFLVADAVLDEHQKNRVQVVMVSSSVHEAIHNGDIFINYKQAHGDIAGFIKKYKDAISNEYRNKINNYIDRSLLHDSNDFGILTLAEPFRIKEDKNEEKEKED
jgi:hypothetical protein